MISPKGAALPDGGKEGVVGSGFLATSRKNVGGDENTITSEAEIQDPAQSKRRRGMIINKKMNLKERVEEIKANNEKKRLIE